MPRECIPQDELVWLEAKPQDRAPYNRCCWFGKLVPTFLGFAGALRLQIVDNTGGLQLNFVASSEQQSLRSHRNSAKVTTAITNRLADDCDVCLANPFLQIFSGSTAIAQNDNWQTTDPLCATMGFACGGAAEIAATVFPTSASEYF